MVEEYLGALCSSNIWLGGRMTENPTYAGENNMWVRKLTSVTPHGGLTTKPGQKVDQL